MKITKKGIERLKQEGIIDSKGEFTEKGKKILSEFEYGESKSK